VKATILVDGQRPPNNYKFKTGYVIQVKSLTTCHRLIVP